MAAQQSTSQTDPFPQFLGFFFVFVVFPETGALCVTHPNLKFRAIRLLQSLKSCNYSAAPMAI